MLRTIATLLLLVSTLLSFGNIARPGIWGGGSGSDFFPLYPSDTTSLKQISMAREHVLIHVYSGFAVVKGTYYMYNSADTAVSLTVGYPINGEYPQQQLFAVDVTELHNLHINVAGNTTDYTKASETNVAVQNYTNHIDNWYVWQANFKPKDTTVIEVYYMVKTSANIRAGYSHKPGMAVTYVLESGRAWAGNIGQGLIEIVLRDGLETSDINGAIPKSILLANDTLLRYSFTQLEPSADNNIVLWFTDNAKGGNFDRAQGNYMSYYAALDAVNYTQVSSGKLKVLEADNFSAETPSSIFMQGLILLLIGIVIFGPIIIIGIFVYGLYKFIKQRNARNKTTHEQTTGRNNNG